jgi:hypothetical protein
MKGGEQRAEAERGGGLEKGKAMRHWRGEGENRGRERRGQERRKW